MNVFDYCLSGLTGDLYECRACSEAIVLPPRVDGLFEQGKTPASVAAHSINPTGCLREDSDSRVVYCLMFMHHGKCYGCEMCYHPLDPCHWRTEVNESGCRKYDHEMNHTSMYADYQAAKEKSMCYGCFVKDLSTERSHRITQLNPHGCGGRTRILHPYNHE